MAARVAIVVINHTDGRRKHEGFSDNASPSWEADMAGRGFSSGSRDTGISVYVGAGAADLHPMLSADIGILVEPDVDVLRLLAAFGVQVKLLMTGAHRGAVRANCPFRNAASHDGGTQRQQAGTALQLVHAAEQFARGT